MLAWEAAPDSEVVLQARFALNAVAPRLRAEGAQILRGPLEAMIEAEVDYMTLNHLGDPEKQHNVIWARAALARADAPTPTAEAGTARELIEDYFRTVFERGNPKSFADDLIAALHAAGYEIRKIPVYRPLWPHQCE